MPACARAPCAPSHPSRCNGLSHVVVHHPSFCYCITVFFFLCGCHGVKWTGPDRVCLFGFRFVTAGPSDPTVLQCNTKEHWCGCPFVFAKRSCAKPCTCYLRAVCAWLMVLFHGSYLKKNSDSGSGRSDLCAAKLTFLTVCLPALTPTLS